MGSKKGFTLLEVLIATAVGGILLGVVVFALNQSAQAARLHQDSQALNEDLRAALGLMADYVNWALAIYPPGSNLTLASSEAYTVRNPRTGNGTWTVGTDPILALVLPPQDPTASCSATQEAGCFRFVAFYLLAREDVVRNASGASNPGADPLNDGSARLLYLYQRVLRNWPPDSGTTGSSGTRLQLIQPNLPFPGNTDIASGRGFLLADYLSGEAAEPGMQLVYRSCLNGGSFGSCGSSSFSSTPPLAFSAAEVEISLRAFRAYRWPGRGVEVRLAQAATPRNLSLLLR